MSRARVIFMGTPDFAVPSLRALCERGDLCDVVAVVTREDKPAGRGRKLTPPPVKVFADSSGVPVLQPKGVKKPEVQDQLRSFKPDLIIVAAYGRILPPAVLEIPSHACVNVHASLLPRHRGASPIAHAILGGDAETGISIMQMDEGMDTGPVFSHRAIQMPSDATCGSATNTLAGLGADCLLEALPGILDGSLEPQPQNDDDATYAPLLKKEHGELSFLEPAEQLERKVRAFCPWPGAFATKGDLRVQILRASAIDARGDPGSVLEAGPDGVVVACSTGGLRLEEVKPAGRKAMGAAAWTAGRGVAKGDQLNKT
ncbi:methionyl-tRNA formyltransferase [Myxococcota bacterium]